MKSNANAINLKAKIDVSKSIFKARRTLQKFAKAVYLEIGYRIVQRSPVGDPATWHPAYWPKGYIPGHFINNWQVGIDQIPKGTFSHIDPMGADSYARLQKLGRWQLGHTYYFVNNLPYAKALEEGHSGQAPMGIIGLTRKEFKQIVKDVQVNFVVNGGDQE